MNSLQKTKQYKNNSYLNHIRSFNCLVCSSECVDAHHMRGIERAGMGMRRSGDQWSVPLCRTHHVESHMYGDEQMWWATKGTNAKQWAENKFKEWSKNHGKA